MGWNSGYTIFEATVIGAYDLGKLDKNMLTVLMEPYRGSDIDSAGSRNLKAQDGKEVRQIVIETWGLELPDESLKAPPDADDNDDWDYYDNAIYERFHEVTKHFGW
jgi:hypothetical protein